jgi:hypothetical protein
MTPIDAGHIAADDLHLMALAELDTRAADRAHLAVSCTCSSIEKLSDGASKTRRGREVVNRKAKPPAVTTQWR